MNVLVIYAHPNPASFNHAILEAVVKTFQNRGHACTVRDLYGIRFDPILAPADFDAIQKGSARPDVADEQRFVQAADLLVFIHPIWWFSVPAILKGWIDRVFTYGFAYTVTDQGPAPLLRGKKAAIFNTTGGAEAAYEQGGFHTALKAVFETGTLAFCGIETIHHRFFHAVPYVTPEERTAMLLQAKQDAERLAAS